jgi:PPM family protein phosphatase
MLTAFALSDTGLVRPGNEDGYLCDEALGLFAVADGMGGHSAGEVASRIAVQTVDAFIRRVAEPPDAGWPYGIDPGLSDAGNRLRTAINLANRRVLRAAESNDDYAGMGTTFTGLLVCGGLATFGHAGDSRLYLLSDGAFRQVTRDDTWVAAILANDPSIGPADLARHPMRHVLTNVVGARDQFDLQLGEFRLLPDALLLLCSDGLHGMVGDSVLQARMQAGGPLDAMAGDLVAAALAAGGQDNVTVVLVRPGESA